MHDYAFWGCGCGLINLAVYNPPPSLVSLISQGVAKTFSLFSIFAARSCVGIVFYFVPALLLVFWVSIQIRFWGAHIWWLPFLPAAASPVNLLLPLI